MPALGHKSYIQFGPKETTYGTYLAPTRKLEIINWNIAPVIGSIMDPSLYGAASRRSIYQGSLVYRGSFSIRLNYEGLEEIFRAVFGTYTKTVANGNVNDHNFTEGSTLDPHSFEVSLGDVPTGKVFRLLGAKLTGLTIKGAAGSGSDAMLTADITVVAQDYVSDQTPVAAVTRATVASCTGSSYTLTRSSGSFTSDGVIAGDYIIHPYVPVGTVAVSVGTTTLTMSSAATASTSSTAVFKTMQLPKIAPVLYTHAVIVSDGTSDVAPRVRSFEVSLEQPHAEDRFYLGGSNKIDEPVRQDFLVARFKFTQEFNTKTGHDAARAFTVGAPRLLFRDTSEDFGSNYYREFEVRANKANLVEFSAPVEGYGVLISTATWEAWYDTSDASALFLRTRNMLSAIS